MPIPFRDRFERWTPVFVAIFRFGLFRFFVCLLLVGLAYFLMQSATDQTTQWRRDLGVNILAAAVSVAIIDWLYDLRNKHREAVALSSDLLLRFEHAIWLWLGGPRRSDLSMLLGKLAAVDAGTPAPTANTWSAFRRVGILADNLHWTRDDITPLKSELLEALNKLAAFAPINDPGGIADVLSLAIDCTDAIHALIPASSNMQPMELHPDADWQLEPNDAQQQERFLQDPNP